MKEPKLVVELVHLMDNGMQISSFGSSNYEAHKNATTEIIVTAVTCDAMVYKIFKFNCN